MNKTRYFVSRKNPLTWISALLLLAAIVFRIAAVTFWKGEGVGSETMWFAVILPSFALLVFVLQILICGDRTFYKTAIPVWIMCLSTAIYYTFTAKEQRTAMILLVWLMFVAFAIAYTAITAGRTKRDWALVPMFALPFVYLLYHHWAVVKAISFAEEPIVFAQLFELFAGFLLVFAIRVFADGKYHPTWGDRSDGRRVRTLDPISIIATYIMPNRGGASNFVHDSVEITELERYIRKKRAEGLSDFGITDAFLAAYVRIVAKYPAANRFLSGQRVYSRDEDIQFCMVVKKEMSTSGSESIMKLHLTPYDTADVVYQKFHEAVEKIRNTPLDSNFDNTAKYLTYIPGVLLKFVIWFLKTLDYFGLLPRFLLEVSPFHASVFFTSMGSLGIPPIVHHLYDFGNMPVFCAFGAKRKENEVLPDGSVVTKKYVDYTFNTDERTVDGFYYAELLRYFRKLLRHPEVLDEKPQEVLHDID